MHRPIWSYLICFDRDALLELVRHVFGFREVGGAGAVDDCENDVLVLDPHDLPGVECERCASHFEQNFEAGEELCIASRLKIVVREVTL